MAAVPVQERLVQLLLLGVRCRRVRLRRQEGVKAATLRRVTSRMRTCTGSRTCSDDGTCTDGRTCADRRTCADGVILLHAVEHHVHIWIPFPARNLGAQIDVLPTRVKWRLLQTGEVVEQGFDEAVDPVSTLGARLPVVDGQNRGNGNGVDR